MARSPILALPILLAATPALALTPEELWSAWQAQAKGFGATITAEVVPGGDGSLTLRDFARQMGSGPVEPMPEDAPIQEVVLRPQADGAVLIDLGLPARGRLGPEGEAIWLEQEAFALTARDSPEGIDYELVADLIQVAPLDQDPEFATDIAFGVSGLRVAFPGQVGPDQTVEVSLSLDGFAYVTDVVDREYGFGSRQAGRGEAPISLRASLTLPPGIGLDGLDQIDLGAALTQGFAVRLDMEAGAGTQEASVSGFPFAYSYDARFEPGTGSFAFDRSGIAFTADYGGASMTVRAPDLPVPEFGLSFAGFATEFRIPGGPEVGEARFLLSLEELVVGEEAWALLDPQATIPREPASLFVDVTGRVAIDLAAVMASAEAGGEPPMPVMDSVQGQAELRAGGALASGEAAFTFDNSTGVPVPQGGGTARIEGADRLLDAAVALGWLSREQATQARFGLAAVFRPGDAPDTRVTEFQLRPDGTAVVNGVPMP